MFHRAAPRPLLAIAAGGCPPHPLEAPPRSCTRSSRKSASGSGSGYALPSSPPNTESPAASSSPPLRRSRRDCGREGMLSAGLVRRHQGCHRAVTPPAPAPIGEMALRRTTKLSASPPTRPCARIKEKGMYKCQVSSKRKNDLLVGSFIHERPSVSPSTCHLVATCRHGQHGAADLLFVCVCALSKAAPDR
jgi:hypothetical protein